MKRIDDIKEYLHGNRKGKAANRMEREALSDPFLFEALEGLTSTPGDPLDGLIPVHLVNKNGHGCILRPRLLFC